jgi:hypothetical protein
MLNKGFSLWDESYYLLSYKMAFEGFYPHFTNTPFLVSKMFEWFHPGLIGYRIIHLLLSLISSGSITLMVITYLETTTLKLKSLEKVFLASMAFFSSMYAYQISLTTLSYNHLNEFFYLTSQSCLIFALGRKHFDKKTIILLLLSGLLACLDVFIKPPSFILLVLGNIFLIYLLRWKTKTCGWSIFYFLIGLIGSFILSLFLIMHPADWSAYFTFMQSHTSHSPKVVLLSFCKSGFDMLKSSIWVISFSLIAILLSSFKEKIKTFLSKYSIQFIYSAVYSIIIILGIFFLIKLVFPKDIWNSFNIHWWFWWVYSSTFLTAIVIIFSIGGLIVNKLNSSNDRFKILLLFLFLIVTPLALSVGTLNGFGQVQMNLISWMLLVSIVLIIFFRYSPVEIKNYSALLISVYLLISTLYFTRQISSGNISGQGSIRKLTFKIEEGLLQNIFVDEKTYTLLNEINSILSLYPKAPTVVFFDLPGLQYAFNHQWIVKDPWLSNLKAPPTKDDLYNCKTITKEKNLKGVIFIVAGSKDISPELQLCLQKIGYPNKLIFLGATKTSMDYMKEPIKLYLHP